MKVKLVFSFFLLYKICLFRSGFVFVLYGMFRGVLPVNKLTTKLITANAKNINKRTLPTSIDTPAKLFAPNNIDISANTKKAIAALNMYYSLLL
jgi:hypothetical protein